MIIEYRAKRSNDNWFVDTVNWRTMNSDMVFIDFNFDFYSIRINKDRQFHRADTPGCKEEWEKAMMWMKLTADPDEEYW